MITLHVSALGAAASCPVMSGVSLSFSVTVAKNLPTASLAWSTVPSISNSTLPTFILTRIGFCCSPEASVIPIPYCLLYCATCSCATLKYSPTCHIMPIGEFN